MNLGLDVVSLKEIFDVAQLTRQSIADVFTSPDLNLHQRFQDLGYRELRPVICEYGKGYVSPDKVLANRSDGRRSLLIVMPAEFVPGSEAARILDESSKTHREVYAVYSQF